MESKFLVGGEFYIECYDKNGNFKWADIAKNAVVNEGLNHLLDVELHAVTKVGTWYIGLISITGWSAFAAGDTLASHAGWTEGAGYTGTRKEWTEGAASGQVITNASSVDFAMTGTDTIKGAFLCSVTSGTSGVLFCEALFTGGDQGVGNGDTLKVTYSVTASHA
jgi:hypothetical protein